MLKFAKNIAADALRAPVRIIKIKGERFVGGKFVSDYGRTPEGHANDGRILWKEVA